jgi:hypothetical protein
MARGWLVSLSLVVALACSGRTRDEDAPTEPGIAGAAGDASVGGTSATGGRASTGGAAETGGAPTGGGTGTGGAPASGECVLAYRHGRCCPEPEPVTRDELESEPCLQEWTPLSPAPIKPSTCEFPECAVACEAVPPVSRVVELAADGRCRFASECESADDCTILLDRVVCCPCGGAFPESWKGNFECLLPVDEIPPISCGFCGEIACAPCPVQGLSCERGADGLGRCVRGKALDLPPDSCAAEQACGANPMHVCSVCVAPGDAACGGPAPPPDECESDADCRERADNLICEQLPCQNRRCVQGCLLDDDCGEAEACDDYHCRPVACSAAGECGPNHDCASDLCVRRTCKTSAECGDYCVNGACYDEAGRCADGCLP